MQFLQPSHTKTTSCSFLAELVFGNSFRCSPEISQWVLIKIPSRTPQNDITDTGPSYPRPRRRSIGCYILCIDRPATTRYRTSALVHSVRGTLITSRVCALSSPGKHVQQQKGSAMHQPTLLPTPICSHHHHIDWRCCCCCCCCTYSYLLTLIS